MTRRKVRVGIDVGGTFTDAVAIDNDTLEIISQIKVMTTHDAPRGVAEGVVQALHKLLAEGAFAADEVVFIAHGTTQATNALLEGDVVKVGVIGMGSGLDGLRARGQCRIESIPLSQGHMLETAYTYLDTAQPPTDEQIQEAIQEMQACAAQVVVASEAYSVDDPRNELRVMEKVRESGLPACGTHQISKRYGLKIRTRTAVVNASILPKMTRTADMTESSVHEAGIPAPLMIMRGDGGAMSIDEMRTRPILTLLSGPAAGVAGALMYARISDGVFLEVGGTSTDISAIRNGQVAVDYATVGGHLTYLPSLDVRTVGLAGGSMIRLRDGQLAEVGPRSAHIAGLAYEVYAQPDDIVDPELLVIRPKPEDPEEYLAIRTATGKVFALTLSGAANLAGMVQPEDYAYGSAEAARRAFAPLGKRLGMTADEVALRILDIAISKVIPPVQELMRKYELDASNVVLVGGGGGCAAVTRYLAKKLGYRHEVAPNAQVISTIGVALAMVRDMVERTIAHPTEEDILRVRREAEEAVLRMGAVPESIDITVSIDTQLNVVRAVATGALAMRARDLCAAQATPEARKQIAADSLGTDGDQVRFEAGTDQLDVFTGSVEVKRLFGLFTDHKRPGRVVDCDGVVRLKLADARVRTTTHDRLPTELKRLVDDNSNYADGGQMVPDVFLLYGARLANLTGLASAQQIVALAQEELRGIPEETKVVIVADKR